MLPQFTLLLLHDGGIDGGRCRASSALSRLHGSQHAWCGCHAWGQDRRTSPPGQPSKQLGTYTLWQGKYRHALASLVQDSFLQWWNVISRYGYRYPTH